MQQPIEQTRAQGIPGAGGIDGIYFRWLDRKTVSLRIEGMDLSGTVGGDHNSPGYGLQLSGVLTNIHAWETLTYIRARIGSNTGEGKHRMIGPDHITDGSGYTCLKSQLRGRQTLRSAVEIKGQIPDTLQH